MQGSKNWLYNVLGISWQELLKLELQHMLLTPFAEIVPLIWLGWEGAVVFTGVVSLSILSKSEMKSSATLGMQANNLAS